MKQRKPFFEKLDLMEEARPRQPLVEVCGYSRVIVENHRGVLEYGKERISARVPFGAIRIEGTGLLLRKMCGQQLVITGNIAAIRWEKGE